MNEIMPLECVKVGITYEKIYKNPSDLFPLFCCVFQDYKYFQTLSEGVLRLQERGVMKKLHEKWWKQKRGGGKCDVI